MKGLIVAGAVAVAGVVWYQKFASLAERSDTRCAIKMLTGIRMKADPGRG